MTELTVIQTGEVVEQLSRVEAERITARIADKLDAIADNLEQVLPLIGEALTRRAWEALGYSSPTAYVSERFEGALHRLSPEVRRPVVAQLSAAGMSTRAIAPVVGVSHMTAKRDLEAPVTPVTPAPTETPASLPTSDTITGMDGKQYARPVPVEKPEPTGQVRTKRPRRPIHEVVREAGMNARDAADKLASVLADERFTPETNELTPQVRNQLIYVIEVCQDLLDDLTPEGDITP